MAFYAIAWLLVTTGMLVSASSGATASTSRRLVHKMKMASAPAAAIANRRDGKSAAAFRTS